MEGIRVESEVLRNYREILSGINSKARNAFADVANSMIAVDLFLLNSQTENNKNKLMHQRGIVASKFDGLSKHINKLDVIAREYEDTERRNIDESNTLNTGGF